MGEQRIIGMDIGGANVKFAVIGDEGTLLAAHSHSFPMWTDANRLATFLEHQLASLGNADAVAITMTGEMADGFLDRSEGVRCIVAASHQAAMNHGVDRIGYYGVDGWFHPHSDAIEQVDLIAAANWHATTSWVARTLMTQTPVTPTGMIPHGILMDIGSTTTDIIPFRRGVVATDAKTDHDRLAEGSLLYVGCGRTPVCALVSELPFRGRACPVMNEVFATIDDAMILTGRVAEDPSCQNSADGRARTRSMAANRLARMIGRDQRSVSPDEALLMAEQVIGAAREAIANGFSKMDNGGTVVVVGHGSGLFDVPDHRDLISLEDHWGSDASRCFPAWAVACRYQCQGANP